MPQSRVCVLHAIDLTAGCTRAAPAVRASRSYGDLKSDAREIPHTHDVGNVLMADFMYPPRTPEIATHREELAPEIHQAWNQLSKAVFADGAHAHSTIALNASGGHSHDADGDE